jgi:uncharacterized protein YbbC (DUF1343 family)
VLYCCAIQLNSFFLIGVLFICDMNEPLFQKSLQDLIKGIRNNKRDPSSFVSQAILDIKNELKSVDNFTKAEAVQTPFDF